MAWTLEHTDERSKAFMRDLPFDLRFDLGDQRVRLVHGSPRKVNEYLFEDKPARTFERIAAGADCDVLVFGHTHKPWVARVRRRAVRQLRLGRQAQGRRPARRLRGARGAGDRVERDDRARASTTPSRSRREVAAAGLPGEYAEKLLTAA